MKLTILALLFTALGWSQEVAPPDVEKLQAEVQRSAKILKDWANLGRYRSDNAKVTATAVVFMGDSITDGWGKKYGGQFFPGKPYLNRGIGGQTTPQMLIRFRPDVIAHHPKVVVILAGTNDIAGNTGPTTLEAIEDNLMSMVELAHANGINVVFSSVMPVCDYMKPQTVRRPPDQIIALNTWMKDYASKKALEYLDYYTPMLDDTQMLKQELTFDGLHPNDAGYEIMVPLVEKAIATALKMGKPHR